MAMTAAQIVTLACQIAKCSGFTSQAGLKLNAILQELCQTYDFELARLTTTITFNGTTGPYSLPSDYLRARKGDVFYTYLGVPYFMIPVDIAQYDSFVQQAGLNDFPRFFATNMAASPPTLLVWPPPSLVVDVTVRYYAQMPEITTPETSSSVPWFPMDNYLITRLSGELMQITDDDRAAAFLTDKEEQNPQGAGVILRRYLNLKDDPEGKVNTVQLDRTLFGTNRWAALPSTKNIGW